MKTILSENTDKAAADVLKDEKPAIWVFSSSNGGTGSSSLLDRFNRGGGDKFGLFAARPDETDWANYNKWPVYSYALAIDTESDNGNKVIEPQMFDNTAELCYFLHTSAAGDCMVSRLDNDFAINAPLTTNPRNAGDDAFEWTKSLVGAGYKVIAKADDMLKEYVTDRLRYDISAYGLIGFEFETVMPDPNAQKSCSLKVLQ